MSSPWTVDYTVLLDPLQGDILRVRIRTERGRVVDFVVQYELELAGLPAPVVRYDGSHGRGHRDVLDRRGATIVGRKRWLPEEWTLEQALAYGRQDLLQNWPRYRDDFLRRLS